MLDIVTDDNRDLLITENGDIRLGLDIPQAVKTQLLWIAGEWRLGPDIGLPWFEELLVKNPNKELLESLVRGTIMEVDGVNDCDVTVQTFDRKNRTMMISYTIATDDGDFTEEVELNG